MLDLRCMDCMEMMKLFPDKHFDLAIVDPPYGIGDFRRGKSRAIHKRIEWNNKIPPAGYFKQLERVSKNQIIWGANYFNNFPSGGALVWYKKRGTSTISQCEIASLSFQRKVDYVEIPLMKGCCATTKIIHPCQKPVKLYELAQVSMF